MYITWRNTKIVPVMIPKKLLWQTMFMRNAQSITREKFNSYAVKLTLLTETFDTDALLWILYASVVMERTCMALIAANRLSCCKYNWATCLQKKAAFR